ncbi:MAG: cation-translocating P-type ATPase, partial [Acidobacteriaceae bacterium]|nr:cation-translocating P-type ATPase [Acidobacteriaceae bacterium]
MSHTAQITFPVSGMSCAACQSFVERTLQGQPGVTKAAVNLMLNQATVTFEPEVVSPDALVEAVRDTGYGADLPQTGRAVMEEQAEQDTAADREYIALRVKAVVALIAGAIAMCAMPYMHGHPFVSYAVLIMTVFIIAWAGARFYTKAWSSLLHRTADMNTLIALGTGAAFVFSLFSHEKYYETVIFIIALVLTGNTLEARARRQTTEALRNLVALQPKTARVITGDQEMDVPVEQLRPGLQILVRPGERVAADGVIVSGTSSIDESMVTGESMPVDKQAGS